MKRVLLVLLLVFSSMASFASHIYGGEMIYEYVRTNSNGTKTYRITLRLFRDDLAGNNAAPLPAQVFIGVFDYGTKKNYPANTPHHVVGRTSGPTPVPVNISPCITGNVQAAYSVASYTLTIDLPENEDGYLGVYETCCRVNNLTNVFHPGGTGGTGSTYVTRIPGTKQLSWSKNNSSPQFVTSLDLVCYDRPFTWNFGASDPDGDVLEYSFTPAYHSPTATSAQEVTPASPSSTGPDYPLVNYINGFNANLPLGGRVSIDPKTGIISGIAPALGQYVVAVLIKEFRDGVQISEHRKDFILRVQDCDIPTATLKPNYPVCDQFTFTFQNEAPTSPLIKNYYWEVSYNGTVINTATTPQFTHTFADTGVYTIKLVVNRGDPCESSSTGLARVFPGFDPKFIVEAPCTQKPTKFIDQSTARYGVVDKWSWDLGEPNTNADLFTIQNPSYQYPTIGRKKVTLIVGSNKGCIKTFTQDVDIFDKPLLSVNTKDTLMCKGDETQLEAFGNGTFTWTPLYNIRGENTSKPVVYPEVTTTYNVQLNDNGCINNESIRVRVVNFVTLKANNDTTICLTDSVQLGATSDGLRFIWKSSVSDQEIDNPNLKDTKAKPTAISTIYNIEARIGNCVETDNIIVKAAPYPLVNAGADTTICFNTAAQLDASMDGTQFTWSPVNTLSNPAILNPMARPKETTKYVLTVLNPASGCPKPSRDTIIVNVLERIIPFAGRDTAVIVGQPLQFNATGGTSYIWSPGTSLSSTTIPNPVGLYDGSFESIRYKLTAIVGQCLDSTYVTVKIFKTPAQVFVPTGFTPNGDGRNDRIRPIAVGITKIEYFRVYNRWGQQVFSTTVNGDGWDGKIKGKEQGTGVYAWVVKAVDYTGKEFFAKGTLTLIR